MCTVQYVALDALGKMHRMHCTHALYVLDVLDVFDVLYCSACTVRTVHVVCTVLFVLYCMSLYCIVAPAILPRVTDMYENLASTRTQRVDYASTVMLALAETQDSMRSRFYRELSV